MKCNSENEASCSRLYLFIEVKEGTILEGKTRQEILRVAKNIYFIDFVQLLKIDENKSSHSIHLSHVLLRIFFNFALLFVDRHRPVHASIIT